MESVATEIDPLIPHLDARRHPTEALAGLDDHDLVSGLRRQERRRETSGSGTDDEDAHP